MKRCGLSIIALLGIFSLVAQSTNGTKNYNRKKFKHVVSMEVGFKTLSGLGVNYSYHINELVAVDAGLGFGYINSRVKLGLQGRLHVMKTNLAPYIYAGFSTFPISGRKKGLQTASGWQYGIRELHPLLQGRLGVGIDWLYWDGFNLRLYSGFQQTFTKTLSSIRYTKSPSVAVPEKNSWINLIYGKGINFGLCLGFAF